MKQRTTRRLAQYSLRGLSMLMLGAALLTGTSCTTQKQAPVAVPSVVPAAARTPGYSSVVTLTGIDPAMDAEQLYLELDQFSQGPDGKLQVMNKDKAGSSYEKKGSQITVKADGGAVTTLSVEDFKKQTPLVRERYRLAACELNVKSIGTALEMYAQNSEGRFPTALTSLVPNYLKAIPTCPGADKDTYSSTYKFATSPDAYTVMCTGDFHMKAGSPPNYPQYTFTAKLAVEPSPVPGTAPVPKATRFEDDDKPDAASPAGKDTKTR